jgi:predicted ArsR family transcriptional regulator
MQETRQNILDILRIQGSSTVEGIVNALQTRWERDITAVTVRHHLNVLQSEGYITQPEILYRSTPGRPQHVYTLTDKAHQLFQHNYPELMTKLLQQIRTVLPTQGVNVILEGIADNMALNSNIPNLKEIDWEQRLTLVLQYLNQQGYSASTECHTDGLILHTYNCPYHQVAQQDDTLCSVDLRLISTLLGVVPRRLSRISQGDESCAYLIPVIG